MVPIRVRLIEKKRQSAECRVCFRPIERNEACAEIIYYEEGAVWSEYDCCTPPYDIRTSNPRDAFRLTSGLCYIA